MTTPSLGLVTLVHGRHDHLLLQQRSLDLGQSPDVRVVVAIDDDDVAPLVPGAHVVAVPGRPGGLPLAAARNAGARAALDLGAERLVFLDVDCLVGAHTLTAYAEAADPADLARAAETGDPAGSADTVWCGPVTYLGQAERPYPLHRLAELDDPHPARPDPGPGRTRVEHRWELFWSLSFALDAATWTRIGGFDEAYVGYGAEDTDFGQRAARAGCRLVWSGDARAYHQWHPTASPPAHHRVDIVRNANLFLERWGWSPMSGWLDALRERGLVDRTDGHWVVTG